MSPRKHRRRGTPPTSNRHTLTRNEQDILVYALENLERYITLGSNIPALGLTYENEQYAATLETIRNLAEEILHQEVA